MKNAVKYAWDKFISIPMGAWVIFDLAMLVWVTAEDFTSFFWMDVPPVAFVIFWAFMLGLNLERWIIEKVGVEEKKNRDKTLV